MPSFAFEFAANVLLTLLGIGFGWWIRSCLFSIRTTSGDNGDTTAADAREALGRLRDLAARVAADVGEHSHRVEEINEELTTTDLRETESVVNVVAKLVQVNKRMQQQLASAEGKLQEQARQIESKAAEARTDFLTLLANRRALDDHIDRLLAEARQSGGAFSVAMLDIDHFKRFNDAYGHQAGDEVLRRIARVLCAGSREGDIVARYGGEEFAILFPKTGAAEASLWVERIRESIDLAHFRFQGKSLHVTASLGVAELLPDEEAAALVQRADAALYGAKQAGRNCAHWHDGEKIHPIVRPEAAMAKAEPAAIEPLARAETARPASGADKNEAARLANRTAFCSLLSNRLAQYRREGSPPSVILARVDRFKRMTADHGEHAGQMVLRTLAQFLLAAVREMDTVAYYDSVTFAMLLPGTSLLHAAMVAERLRRAVTESSLPLAGGQLHFTISLGGAEANEGDDLERLLRRTEIALDCAVRGGGNSSYYHNGQWSEIANAFLERAPAAG